MKLLSKYTKYFLYFAAGNVAAILTIILFPVFLFTDQIDLLNNWLNYIWKSH